MQMQTLMVGWRKGWATAAHTYVVEVANGSVWLGRLGKGGAYWRPQPGTAYFKVRIEGTTFEERTNPGVALGMAIGRKGLEKFREEIERNEQRYRAEGRSALAGDKRTAEFPLTEFADARIVEDLPGSGPPAVKGLGPGFVEARLDGKTHYFAGVPGAATAEEFHHGLMAALGR